MSRQDSYLDIKDNINFRIYKTQEQASLKLLRDMYKEDLPLQNTYAYECPAKYII